MNTVEIVSGDLGGKACCIGAGTLVLENFFGVAHLVMAPTAASHLPEPAFESTVVWPQLAELGAVLKPSNIRVAWAGNLQPEFLRIRTGEHFSVTVDVRLETEAGANDAESVNALLHWDRVGLFGANWTTPKNSPMRLLSQHEGVLTYGVTLGSLPPGRYEFTAHVLGANDIWVRTTRQSEENNGRVEVIPARAAAVGRGSSETDQPARRKEADGQRELVKR